MSRRKEMKNSYIGFQDGFSGTGVVDDLSVSPSDTTILIDEDLNVLHDDAELVPVGARFTTEGISTIRTITARNANTQFQITIGADTTGSYTITVNGVTSAAIQGTDTLATVQSTLEAMSNIAVGDVVVTEPTADVFVIEFTGTFVDTAVTVSATPTDLDNFATETLHVGAKTWSLTFTPAVAAGETITDEDTIAYLPQRVIAKVGDGDFEWNEPGEPVFDKDRDRLDGVRSGPEVEMDVTMSLVLNWLRASSGQPVTIYEVLHREGGAADWHNTATDPCEPYAPTIFVFDIPPCGSEPAEVMYFPQFYPTNKRGSIRDAVLELTGKCNATKPVITREQLDLAVILEEFGLEA